MEENKNNGVGSVEKEEKVNKKRLFLLLFLLFLLVIFVIGVSYQVYLYTDSGTSIINKIFGGEEDIFKNNTVTVVYTESESSVRIENAVPMADEVGMRLSNHEQLMDFTVSISIAKSSAVSYEVVAEKDPSSTIPDRYIKIYLQRSIQNPTYEEEIMKPTRYEGVKEEDDYGVPSGNMVLDQVTTSESTIYYYRLRMWLADDYQLDNTYRYFTIKINVYGKGERIKDQKKEK